MAIEMSEVFAKKFPVKPEDITTTTPAEAEKIHEALIANLALAEEHYERTFRPPSPEIMNQEMTE